MAGGGGGELGFIRARLLSRTALSIQQPMAALEHALTAVQLCGAASPSPSIWPCAVAHFELSFAHNKLGNTSAAVDAFKVGVAAGLGSGNGLAPPQPTSASLPQPPKQHSL